MGALRPHMRGYYHAHPDARLRFKSPDKAIENAVDSKSVGPQGHEVFPAILLAVRLIR